MEEKKISYKHLFIAIEIEKIDSIHLLINTLKSKLLAEKILWVQSKNLHLTINFLGKTEVDKIEKIEDVIKSCCEELKSFPIEYGKIGIFGSKHAPKVVWLEAKSNGILESLEKNLSKNLIELGFEEDRQNFVPHLTLARIHNPLKSKAYFQKVIDAHKNPELPPFQVNKIILYSSRLSDDGPIYTIEKSINL